MRDRRRRRRARRDALLRRRRVPVDLPLPPRRRRRCSAARREQTGGVLSLPRTTARGPRCWGRQPPVRRRVRPHVRAARPPTARFPELRLGPAVELLVTDKSTLLGHGHRVARTPRPRHVARGCARWWPRARQRRRMVLLFSAGTDARRTSRRCRRPGWRPSAPPAASTSSPSRSSTCSPTCG